MGLPASSSDSESLSDVEMVKIGVFPVVWPLIPSLLLTSPSWLWLGCSVGNRLLGWGTPDVKYAVSNDIPLINGSFFSILLSAAVEPGIWD